MVEDDRFYILTTQISSLFLAELQVQMMIDVDTFYINETTTIQCSASESTTRLDLRTSVSGVERDTGCTYGGGEWTNSDSIFSQKLISKSYCDTASQSTPFIITIQPTVTEQLEGLEFRCRAYDTVTRTPKDTVSVTVNNIRGKLIFNYLLFSECFSKLIVFCNQLDHL